MGDVCTQATIEKDSRLKNSIINESHPFRGNGNKITKSSSDYCSIASSDYSTLSYDFIATNVYMQTDLNADSEIKTVSICFRMAAYDAFIIEF